MTVNFKFHISHSSIVIGQLKVCKSNTVGYEPLLRVMISDFATGLPSSPSKWNSPEQRGKERGISAKSDVFAIGCLIHFAFSGGKHPFGDGNSPCNIEQSIDIRAKQLIGTPFQN